MSNRCRRLPTRSRRETKSPQRIASPASEPALRPTPTPVNVSLGATTHSTPLPTVLPASFFRSLLLRSHRVGDRDIRLTWSTSPAGVAPWHSAAAFHRPRQEFLRTPHTDQLRRMVAIADRSP